MAVYDCLPHPSDGNETLLWTNPSPTSGANTFTCALSDLATNYKRIKIVYRTFSSDTFTSEVQYSMENGNNELYVAGTNLPRFALTGNGASYGYARFGWFTSQLVNYVSVPNYASISFDNSYRLNNANTLNTSMIPLYIYGIK